MQPGPASCGPPSRRVMRSTASGIRSPPASHAAVPRRAGREAAFPRRRAGAGALSRGTITQLDLLQAQRDAFNSEVSRIQADADLINARVQLRLSAGGSLLAAKDGGGYR